jgi:hypothetical protein
MTIPQCICLRRVASSIKQKRIPSIMYSNELNQEFKTIRMVVFKNLGSRNIYQNMLENQSYAEYQKSKSQVHNLTDISEQAR